MAAPTVSFFSASAGTNSSLLSVWMQQLHSMLIAKGWTLAYADADAIGSSLDPSTPAWDKTPSSSTDAGVAVYRMPANGHDTQWYVRLRPGWHNATSRPYMRGVTIGTNHDGTGGVTGGGTELEPGTNSVNTDSRQVLISVSEDGLFLLLPATNSPVRVQVERARRPDGTVEDDLIAQVAFSSTTVAAAVINAASGVISTNNPIAFGEFTNSTSPGAFSYSLLGRDSVQVPIIGPFWPMGYPVFGPHRLAFMIPSGDAEADALQSFYVDGATRLYKTAASGQGTSWAAWVVATE